MSNEPGMSDGQFTNVFSLVIGGIVLVVIVLIIVAAVIGSRVQHSDLNAKAREALVAKHIRPVGQINIGKTAAAPANAPASGGSTEVASGQAVFNQTCHICHATGVAGAPVFGNADDWAPRIAKGKETLYQHALHGFQGDSGVMPPKGGNASLSDAAVKAAVDYMVGAVQSGGEGTEQNAAAAAPPADSDPVAETVSQGTAAALNDAAAESTATQMTSGEPRVESADSEPVAASTEASSGEVASATSTGTAGGEPKVGRTGAEPAASSTGTAAGGTKVATAAPTGPSGEKVYNKTCHICHATGVAGAPVFGDTGAWSARIAEGLDTLYQHAIHGFQGESGVMPPKGGDMSLSDEEVEAAVRYMVEAAQ